MTTLVVPDLAACAWTPFAVNAAFSQATTSSGVLGPSGAGRSRAGWPLMAIRNVSPGAKVHPAGVPVAAVPFVAEARNFEIPLRATFVSTGCEWERGP